MSNNYLELTEDQMVEELQAIQKLARIMFNAGKIEPYDLKAHEIACTEVVKKMNKLAIQGDVI